MGHDHFGCLRARRRGAGDLAADARPRGWSCRRPSTARSPATRAWRAASPARAVLRVRRGAVFRSDDAPADVAAQRRAGFARLSALYSDALRQDDRAAPPRRPKAISDLQFTGAYRVPFQYQPHACAQHLPPARSCNRPTGVTVTDLDGNRFYDLTGSYGVNVFGYDFYKECIERGADRVRALGPVLGAYHPLVADNVQRLREISGLDEVSFHMSGTEAVMQAVRLARYHTRRIAPGALLRRLSRLVGRRAAGRRQSAAGARDLHAQGHVRGHAARAAHARATSPACWSIRCRRCTRTRSAPTDSTLVDSARSAHFDKAAYTDWLKRLRAGLHRARHRADLRRGVRRLPPGAGRRAGVLRRPRRPGHLRQDARRRAADRRRLRPARI